MRSYLTATVSLLLLCTVSSGAEPPVDSTTADALVTRTVLRQPGEDGVHTSRIPGLATTPAGTVVAVFDLRHQSAADLPQDIDVGMMRSTDDGETWSSVKPILDFDKNEPGSLGNGVGDPAILVDAQTNTLFVAAIWSKGDRGWKGSGPGVTPDETGQVVLTTSSDDGRTWSAPINTTPHIRGREPQWRLFFCGPGNGIQLKDGTLVFAAQFREPAGPPHSCLLYSTDHGDTWTVSPPAIPDEPPTSEAQVAELDDGALLLTMRDESHSGERVWARWTWNVRPDAETKGTQPAGRWSQPWRTVADPTCMASLIRHPSGALLFSNPNHPSERVALTVRTSSDEGRTWSAGQLLDPRDAMYSSMTVLRDGRIAILYETAGTLTFARFPLEWIEQRGR
ncbi:MAG: exo-alpha-sialidase [Planctomycetaceae bacterium]|nr:exo-alpha-sialidase [Planctomycetaceae bacterium]